MIDIHHKLVLDAPFSERAAALGALVPKEAVRPLDEMFEHMQHFTPIRRREMRIARLDKADRDVPAEWRSNRERVPTAVSGFCVAMKILSEHANTLQPLITPALDDVVALAADDGHPLRQMLHEVALSLGFSSEEAGWLFDELKAIHYRPVKLVCKGGFEDLVTLLSGVSMGEGGLLLAGFLRLTGDPDVDERLEKLVIRLRENGVTASIFMALTIILVAHAVAVQHASR